MVSGQRLRSLVLGFGNLSMWIEINRDRGSPRFCYTSTAKTRDVAVGNSLRSGSGNGPMLLLLLLLLLRMSSPPSSSTSFASVVVVVVMVVVVWLWCWWWWWEWWY